MITFKSTINHFKTITRHRHKVIAHCKKSGILWQGLFHDLSKYSPSEFWVGAKYYQGNKSPNEEERRLYGYSKAWLHHKGRNKHHFEYWYDYNPAAREYMPVPMPKKYIAEMFCDRVAASKIYQGEKYDEAYPLLYFEKGREARFIHPETSELLESFLVMLKEKGEDETLRHIRSLLKKTSDLEY